MALSWSKLLKERLYPTHLARSGESGTQAAVILLIGVDSKTGSENIILTKRTQKVHTHKGQISFPGGFREEEDTDLLATALRETNEEIGVEAPHVELLGCLSPVWTQNNVQIFPWVGTLALPYPFQLNEDEVERLIHLPIAYLKGNGFNPVKVSVGPYRVDSIGLEHESELIWGATAKMLEEFRLKIVDLENPSR